MSEDVSILAAGQFPSRSPADGPDPLQPDRALRAGISPISFLGGYGPLLSNVLNLSFALLGFFFFLPFICIITQLSLAPSFTYLYMLTLKEPPEAPEEGRDPGELGNHW